MNSNERKAARRKREDARRAAKRAKRLECCTLENVADVDNLYMAAKKSSCGVKWKPKTQRYMKDILINTVRSHEDLMENREICGGFNKFYLFDSGKLRHISSVRSFSERVIHKSLTQNALIPSMVPSLIASNSANIENRGTLYAIKLIKAQLIRHWRKHGNDGYILQTDFSGYFANIDHKKLKAQVVSCIDDERVADLVCHLIDVQGNVGLGLGSEPNQILAVSFPNVIDHMVVETCGIEAYGRYMDDIYAIHNDKNVLRETMLAIREKCDSLGITINERKTHLVKLSHGFTFLKKKFYYTNTGKVIIEPSRSTITRERRKLKRQARLCKNGEMSYEQVMQSYQSWRGGLSHINARKHIVSMDAQFKKLMLT